ncbi:CLUMA_CG015713, isoform A [Clunio marinus]|uniref:CLUMA_CG015713, isoform A n=1 Tax=Clunio marinus TaxID=568069 RepID=A0A1J1IQI6_9DIPT|nr:CLUMA_CG015713, isoform A [Clunio marinus]
MSEINCKLALKLDNNQNAIYAPGQLITGLQLRIKGIAKCQMDVGRTRCSAEQQYFHYVRDLFGKKHGMVMLVEPGEMIYTFEYELPSNIPYSTEGKYGEIYYGIKVVLDIPHELDKEIRLPLTIIRYEDLNAMPLLKYPKREEITKTFCYFFICCLGSSPLLMSASIPYTGYIPGQKIPITIELNNQSHVNVRSTKITLKGLHTFNFDYPSTCKQTEKYRLDYKLAAGVKSGKSAKLEEFLMVPEMLNPSNEQNCKVFQITYMIKISATVDDPHQTPCIRIPITIGSFPLIFKDAQPNTHNQMPSKIFNTSRDLARQTKTAQTLYNEVIRLNEF